MATLHVRLFGTFQLERDGVPIHAFEAGKARELLCYLLIHRARPNSREVLQETVWGEIDPERARRNLRQSLWQVHALLDETDEEGSRLLIGDAGTILLNPQADLWLDIALVEDAYAASRGVPIEDMDNALVQQMRKAVEIYHDDLLIDCYQDWCLFERERFQNMHLTMLDKLMAYYEMHGEYELGVAYGGRILQNDRTRERTHVAMMRLLYLAGDRTEAIHQFSRCSDALRQELGVAPSRRTVALYDQIRADQPGLDDGLSHHRSDDVAAGIKTITTLLHELQRQVHELRSELRAYSTERKER